MRRLPCLALLSLALAPACVDPQDPSTSNDPQGIVGGTTDSGDPAVPLVEIGNSGNGGLCSGTVISPHVVLTAGHCLQGESQWTLRFETQYGDNTGPIVPVTDHLQNPNSDMGLLAVANPLSVTPIPFNTEALDSHIGEPTRIVGFGVTSESGNDAGLKRQGMATLDSVDNSQDGGIIFTTNSPQGTCYGDSGGPNFMTLGGVEKVVAETTTGTDICGSGLDIANATDTQAAWIQAFVTAHEGAPTCNGDGQCATGCADPDPDCPCAGDGFCTAACGDISVDPDCTGCEADGECRQGCPVADPDCAGMPDAGPAEGDDTGGGGGGCCSAGGETPAGAAALGLLSFVVMFRRRRKSL